MKVLYTCDNNYVWLMGISVISLFENNKSLEELEVYLLGEKITVENKITLSKIGERYKRRITVVDVPELDIPQALVSARWPISAFTRLFCAQLLSEDIDRILYLDCDTIVSREIGELELIDFDGRVAMGVKDCVGKLYKENIGMKGNDPYFNAGVILFNLDALRKININREIENYINQYISLINYADQDIFNGIFNGMMGVLPPQYNVMTIETVHTYDEIEILRRPTNFYSECDMEKAVDHPIIIHYTTNMRVVRPWFCNTDHPLSDQFRNYMRMSPWNGNELGYFEFTSKEAKIIGIIEKLPRNFALYILGVIHSVLKPKYIRFFTTQNFKRGRTDA